LITDIWSKWLSWDPVRMVPAHAETFKNMRAIYIDAGKRDEFFLDLGAEAFRQALVHVGVTAIYFELFDATHFDIEYRYPVSLKYLAERLSPKML
ncbi:MAG TPA: enterochelin esterase, partial [Ktedonobacteraceae bacterium]|nr:enterochelin esterase [Ktedonobacteraceae bacterium]